MQEFVWNSSPWNAGMGERSVSLISSKGWYQLNGSIPTSRISRNHISSQRNFKGIKLKIITWFAGWTFPIILLSCRTWFLLTYFSQVCKAKRSYSKFNTKKWTHLSHFLQSIVLSLCVKLCTSADIYRTFTWSYAALHKNYWILSHSLRTYNRWVLFSSFVTTTIVLWLLIVVVKLSEVLLEHII